MAKIAGTPTVIRQANMLLVKEVIQKNPYITKPQIAKITQLSLVTVSKLVDELEHQGLVKNTGFQNSTGGRKAMQYVLDTSSGTVITLLIRAQCYYIYLLDLGGNLLCEYTREHCRADWTEELFGVIEEARGKADSAVTALGVAVPGTVSDGVISNIPLIPQWEGSNLRAMLEQRFEIAAIVENDVNASTIGSHGNYGNASVQNMLFLYLDDGIGAGVVIGNKLYKSGRNFAGELGFMDISHIPEAESRGMGLERYVKELICQDRRSDVMDIAARLLRNVCCVLDPDLVVIDSAYLTQEDVPSIQERIRGMIGTDYMPGILVTCVDNELSSKGLFILCKGVMSHAVHIYT